MKAKLSPARNPVPTWLGLEPHFYDYNLTDILVHCPILNLVD
jgi:hypothetical protein